MPKNKNYEENQTGRFDPEMQNMDDILGDLDKSLSDFEDAFGTAPEDVYASYENYEPIQYDIESDMSLDDAINALDAEVEALMDEFDPLPYKEVKPAVKADIQPETIKRKINMPNFDESKVQTVDERALAKQERARKNVQDLEIAFAKLDEVTKALDNFEKGAGRKTPQAIIQLRALLANAKNWEADNKHASIKAKLDHADDILMQMGKIANQQVVAHQRNQQNMFKKASVNPHAHQIYVAVNNVCNEIKVKEKRASAIQKFVGAMTKVGREIKHLFDAPKIGSHRQPRA